MYRVALCDDEKVFSEQQEKLCRHIFKNLNIEYDFKVFNSSSALANAFIQERKRFDLILLDIVMDRPNGIELAGIIRQMDKQAAIIFITSSYDYILQGYDVQALHYLTKPVDIYKLEQLIQSDYQERFHKHFFIFETGTQKLKVEINSILFLETSGRRVKVIQKDGSVYYKGKLTELLEQMPGNLFVRCHQAFAVHIENVRELTKKDAVMIDGNTVPVSRTFIKDVQKAFMKQLRDT